MKCQHLVILAIATVFTISLTKQASYNQPVTECLSLESFKLENTCF